MIKVKFSKMIVAILLVAEIAIVVWFGSSKISKVAENVMQEVASVKGQDKINAEGSVDTISTENWDLNRVHIEYDSEGVPVPVPNGYVGSSIETVLDDEGNVVVEGENTVNTGFVIYEGTEEVTTANKSTAQTTRNQWVWVPIYDVSEIYGVDSNGMMHGKLYNYDSEGRKNENWSEDSNGVMKIKDSSGNREPDIVISYDYDAYLPNYISDEERDELYDELAEMFKNNIKSIKKYGGFYIGRYETGGLNAQAKVVKGETNISSQTWYTMYKKSKTLKGTNENVTTNMIWGSMWDATLEWLVDSGNKTYSEVGSDSTSWGNYYTSTVSGSGSKRPTGYSEIWKANNIYDLAGNVWERTLEAYSIDYRRYRGGNYDYEGSGYPADYRSSGDPVKSSTYYGSRSALFVVQDTDSDTQ